MASPVSKLDGHRQQDQVDRWLLAGQSVRWVASQLDPSVSFQAVQRYRVKLLGPAIRRMASKLNSVANLPVSVVEGNQIVERPLHAVTRESLADERVNPFVERTEQLWQESWSAVQDAKRAVSTFTDSKGTEHIRGRDFSVVAPIINAAARSLELFGRGAGYLTDQPGTPQQNTIVLFMQQSPAGAVDEPAVMTIDVTGEK